MGCLECGDTDFQKFPFTQWVCDKCTEKLMTHWNKLSKYEKIKYLKSNGVKEKDIPNWL
jgi:ribosomal protein L37AE/L43A